MTTLAAPREIRRALGRVGGRLRTVGALKGLGTVALVAAIGAVVGMAVDFLWALPMAARWGIWGAWLAMSGIVALIAVVRPLVRRIAATDLAALAERGQPGIGERLVGSVELLERGDRAHGSPALIEALAGEAAEHARAIEPGRAVPAGRAVRRLMIGVVVAGLVALPPLLRPDPFATLARRFFAPWLDLDRVGLVSLTVTPGDAVVALGSDLDVTARVAPRIGIGLGADLPEAAWIEWDDRAEGTTRRVRMASKATETPGSRLFEARLPRLDGSIRYRVTTAPVTSRRFEIKAVEPPRVATITVQIDPPLYTKLPDGPARDPSRLEVVEGTSITFTLTPSRPVASIDLTWPTFAASGEASRTIEASAGPVRVVAEAPGMYPFTTRARRDEYGIDGPAEPRRLVVRPDAPPVLTIKPVEAKEAGPDDVLTIPMAARDDFAVASAELHFTITRANSEGIEPASARRDLALDGLGTALARGEATLGLSALELNPGDVLMYKIRVADNRPAPKGPNVTWSGEGTLAIVAKAEPMVARADRMRRERVLERIEEIKKENLFNRQETAQLRYAADSARRNPSAWDKDRDAALADRVGSARKVVDDLNALAHDLEGDPAFRPLARPAKEIADVEAEAGRSALDKAAAAPDAAGRLAELRGADARLGAVHQRVEELQRQFEALARSDRERQRLRELAAREDALADRARDLGDDPNALANLRAEQEEVRKEFDAVAATAPDLKAGTLDAQAKEAAALAAKIRDLAARQREESRKTAEGSKRADALKALAEEQRKLEVDARKLAIEVDEPLGENGRGRLNVQPLREAVAPIERGEIEPGRRRLEEAEAELRRVARDAEDVPADPKALARRLARRQGELARQVAEAVREAKGRDNPTAAERAALVAALKPLVDDQAAILKLAEAIKVDEPRKGAARDASQAVGRALDNLRNARPREAEGRQEEARQALNRLAEALPDHWRRDEPARKALEEARRLADEASRDLDRHLRETDPDQPGRPRDPAKSAVDLARRLEPLARKEAEAAAKLAAMEVSPRVEPQRRRAEGRARSLADAMERLRKEAAPLDRVSTALAPIRDWRVVGPFKRDERAPFPMGSLLKPDAKFKGIKGQVTWKPVKAVDDRGKVDLGAIYAKDDNIAAFAAADVVSPESGSARLAIGSDDTLAVWVDGKQVYKFDGNRSYSPEQDRFEAFLTKGTNRIVVKCANLNGEWMFGVMVATPTARRELARVDAARRALPQSASEAKASLDRLGQKLHGQTPADDAAEELAAESSGLAKLAAKPEVVADPASRREAADDQHRLATALRGLNLPDAPALQAEAVRLADAAARALDAPKADAAPEVAKAAEAARALADRLADRLTPRAEAKALARAERALNEADPIVQGRQSRDLAAQVARLEQANPQAPATPHPNPPPQGGRGPEKPSPIGGEPGAKSSQSPSEAAARVAELTERITHPSNDPSRPEPTRPDLAAAGAEAAESLERLAEQLPNTPPIADAPPRERKLPDAPRDPELDPLRARAVEAKALAQRERRLRERLQAVLGERVPPQEDLRRDAAALGRELADLRDRSREPGPSGRGHADVAAELLNNHAARQDDPGPRRAGPGPSRPRPRRPAPGRRADRARRPGRRRPRPCPPPGSSRRRRPRRPRTGPRRPGRGPPTPRRSGTGTGPGPSSRP